ncbi:MAG: restriction endonuclease subunit S [Kiritimatiellae bacterium]|nr:restriction endonuclease subunit S [Kiritimatiellia bacterium]
MKPPESRKAELAPNATGGKKSRAEVAESAEFKMTELGPIPVDWEVKRLGDVVTIQLGKMIDAAKNTGVEKYYISNRDVHWGSIDVSQLHKVRMTEVDLLKYNLQIGDLLVCEGGEVGRSAIWEAPIEDCYFQKTLHRIRFNDRAGLTAPFLLELLHRYAEIGFFDAYVAKTSIAHLPKDKIEILPVMVPPLPEQRKIAEALSDIDELILALGKLIEKKRNIKTGTMQELLGMRNEECGMRNVPRRRLAGFSGAWVEKRFDECFEIIGNNTYARECMCDDCGGVANIHYGDVLIRYGSVLDCSRTAVPSLINSIICRTDRLSDGDVIIADTAEDETVGKAIEIRGIEGRCAVSGLHTIACRPRFDFAPGWLGYYINSSTFHDQLLPLITGTKVSSISKAGLRTTILNVPTIAEQRAIATVLSDIDAEIAALEADRAKYESIKQGMMQELLTGKTRLLQVR